MLHGYEGWETKIFFIIMILRNAACATLVHSCAAMMQKATRTVKTRKALPMEFLPCRVAIRCYKLDSVQDRGASIQRQYGMENFGQRIPMRKTKLTSPCSRWDANSRSAREKMFTTFGIPEVLYRVTTFLIIQLPPTSRCFVPLKSEHTQHSALK